MSEREFDNLVTVIADALNGSRHHHNRSGPRYFTIPASDKGGLPRRELHLQIPASLEGQSDTSPQVTSWIMAAIYSDEYKPGIYRKTTDFPNNSQTGTLTAFRSHRHGS